MKKPYYESYLKATEPLFTSEREFFVHLSLNIYIVFFF